MEESLWSRNGSSPDTTAVGAFRFIRRHSSVMTGGDNTPCLMVKLGELSPGSSSADLLAVTYDVADSTRRLSEDEVLTFRRCGREACAIACPLIINDNGEMQAVASPVEAQPNS